MKVKAICDYTDLQLKRLVKVGEVLTVDENRADVLIKANVAKAVTTPTTKKVAKAKAKKGDE